MCARARRETQAAPRSKTLNNKNTDELRQNTECNKLLRPKNYIKYRRRLECGNGVTSQDEAQIYRRAIIHSLLPTYVILVK